MKTATYLRLSLLIPVLIWGVCLAIVILASASPTSELLSSSSTTITDFIFLFLVFYALGIIIWIFPYLLLSLILLTLSFIVQARVTMRAFALSPIAMTVLTMVLVNLVTLSGSGNGEILSSPLIRDQDFVYFNLLVLAFSLLWSYICVGIGFGIYKLLEHARMIREERIVDSNLSPVPQYG